MKRTIPEGQLSIFDIAPIPTKQPYVVLPSKKRIRQMAEEAYSMYYAPELHPGAKKKIRTRAKQILGRVKGFIQAYEEQQKQLEDQYRQQLQLVEAEMNWYLERIRE